MSADIILGQSPATAALLEKREQLAAVRSRLAERETDLVQLRAQLKLFESRYLRQVAVLYAELDELEARIVEHEAALHNSDDARQRAEEARRRAQESHDAVFADDGDSDEEPFDPPPTLKALFREIAKRVHPDFARDNAEQRYFHVLMARANHAYSRGDVEALQRLLDDHRELNDVAAGESATAESLRISRQIRHAERDLARLDEEHHTLLGSEIAQLYDDAEAATRDHRDLLAELAAKVRAEIAAAQSRLDLLLQQAAVQAELQPSA